jgi:hypothetical protein
MPGNCLGRGRRVESEFRYATAPLGVNGTRDAKHSTRKTSAPEADGDVNLYVFTDLDVTDQSQVVNDTEKVASDIDWGRRAVFINGMGNTGADNMQSSCSLSLLLLCPVISVYNRQSDFFGDVAQCLRDKLKFQAEWGERDAFSKLTERHGATSNQAKISLMKDCLGTGRFGNKATASLFEVLAAGPGAGVEVPVFAHSQGNLILSNALQAVEIAVGGEPIKGKQVFSYGSPAVVWPSGIKHCDHAFTFDLVALLNVIPSWSISKVGWPDGTKWPFTHGFDWYLREDAAFIINRHRTGGWGVTVNMDEEGLAEELVTFGANERRLLKVFQRLDEMHNSDVDDVAAAYVSRLRSLNKSDALRDMKVLVRNLIRYMEEGWTSSGEEDLVKYLKSL